MTVHTKFQCDRCNKEFDREDVIAFGIDTHYCRQCAKLEISDLCTFIKIQCELLDFDDDEGMDALESIYEHLRLTGIDLSEYANQRREWVVYK